MTNAHPDADQWTGVWVFAEQWSQKLEGVAFELLGEGRRLADKLGVPLSAIVVGHDVHPLAQDLISYGADRVYVADDPRLDGYQCSAYAPVLAQLIRRERPEIVLFGATAIGRDLAPRVAAAVKSGLSADCVALDIGDERKLLQIVPAFGGKVMATIITPRLRPQMATVRPGVMKALPREARDGEVISVDVELPSDLKLFTILGVSEEAAQDGAALEEVENIVGGGAGVPDEEGWRLLNELAVALEGAVGGTRPALDDGWISEDQMIGQSGKTVKPKIYIAVGVSGEMQHLVGIQGAQVVVTVNTDPEAAMMSAADYAIVGDYKDVLPPLIEEIKKVS